MWKIYLLENISNQSYSRAMWLVELFLLLYSEYGENFQYLFTAELNLEPQAYTERFLSQYSNHKLNCRSAHLPETQIST